MRASAQAAAVRCPSCQAVTRLKKKPDSVTLLPYVPAPPQVQKYVPPPSEYQWSGLLPVIVGSIVLMSSIANVGAFAGLVQKGATPMLTVLVVSLLMAIASGYYVFTGSDAGRKVMLGLLSLGLLGIFGLWALMGTHPLVITALGIQVTAIFVFMSSAAADYTPGYSMPYGVTAGVGGAFAGLGLLIGVPLVLG